VSYGITSTEENIIKDRVSSLSDVALTVAQSQVLYKGLYWGVEDQSGEFHSFVSLGK
jgi:hypothetical protein